MNFRSPGSDDNPDPRLAKNKLAVLTGVISRYSIFYSVFLLQYVESSFDPGHIKVCKGVQRCIVKDPYYYETFTSKWKCTEIIFFSQQGLNKCAGPSPHGQAKRWKIFAITMTTNSNNKNITTNSTTDITIRRTESSRPPPGWWRTKPTNPAHGARKSGQVPSLDRAHHLQRVDLQL